MMERRSTGAMAGGIVSVSVGGILLFSTLFVAALADTSCAFSNSLNGSGVQSSCPSDTATIIGLTVGGLAAIGVGIPLIIWGAKKVPIGTASAGGLTTPLPAWAGAPAGQGWRWRF
jgi:hypothetical protein